MRIKYLFKNYLPTMLILIIATIATSCAHFLDYSSFYVLISIVAQILVVSLFTIKQLPKEKQKSYLYILATVLSLVLGFWCAYSKIHNSNILQVSMLCMRITNTISSVLGLFAIYLCFKKSKSTFGQFLTSVFIQMIFPLILGFILSFICTFALNYSELANLSYVTSIGYTINNTILALFIVPNLIYSLSNNIKNIDEKLKNTIINVLGISTILINIIVYCYVIFSIPTLNMQGVAIIVFCVGITEIIWTIILSFNSKDKVSTIVSYMPYAQIILLGIASVIVIELINAYAITINKYLTIVMLGFEIIYLFTYLINKTKLSKLIYLAMALIIFSLCMPYVNMYSLSNNMQLFKIKSIVNYYENDLSQITNLDYENLINAYYYLTNTTNRQKTYDTLDDLTKININNLLSEETQEIQDEENNIIEYVASNKNKVAINSNKTVRLIGATYTYTQKGKKELTEFEKIQLTEAKENSVIATVNLKELVDKFIALNIDNTNTQEEMAKLDNILENEEPIKIGDNDFVINNFYMALEKDTNDILYYYVTGYYLEK